MKTRRLATLLLFGAYATAQVPAPGQSIKFDRPPEKSKVFDKRFLSLALADYGLSFADSKVTTRLLALGPCFFETDPIYGRRPSPARMYVTSLGLTTAANLFAAWMKHRGLKAGYWAAPIVFDAGMHGGGIAKTLSANEHYRC